MSTTYLSNYAVTAFDSQKALLDFIANAGGLQILDVDYKHLFIEWKF